MLDPHLAFSAAGTLVLPCWLALILSLFVPATREWTWRVTSLFVPALLAVAYIILLAAGFGATEGGGFGSIAQVRTLFANDSALAAGWLHYLAFDLFIGTWIARTGVAERIHGLLLIPCLILTFLFGPTGLLLFLALRLAFGRRTLAEAAA